MASLYPNERTYRLNPEVDAEDASPNFLIPVYPAYLVAAANPFQLLPTVKITQQSPPVCFVHAHDDKGATSSSASVLMYLEYKKLGLPAELHVYHTGGHGFGMRRGINPVAEWPQRVGEWLKAMGYLEPHGLPESSK
jgi:hypothetical protein